MKAITLTQPWATLVAIGEKRIETRSWGSSYRGLLAIHAAKGWPLEAAALCATEPFRTALVPAADFDRFVTVGREGVSAPDLPRGAIVATCWLTDCIRIERSDHARRRYCAHAAPRERAFGDYTAGRYMWLLDEVQALDTPIPARGSLGLWDWDEVGL